jgi:hypothetical protein
MNEMGHQTWSDARDTICLLPSDLPDRRVYYPVPRTGKCITLIACISADGSYMHPALVISRKTFEGEPFLHGFTSEKVEIYSQTKAYIDSYIFLIGSVAPSPCSYGAPAAVSFLRPHNTGPRARIRTSPPRTPGCCDVATATLFESAPGAVFMSLRYDNEVNCADKQIGAGECTDRSHRSGPCRCWKRKAWICPDISIRSHREISRVGNAKGMGTPDSSKQDRGNLWKRELGFRRACYRGLGL